MKKVLIMNYGLHICGVSRTLVNLANALVDHGYDVTIKIEINDFTLADELDPRVKRELFIPEPYICGIRVRGFLRIYDKILQRIYNCPAVKQYEKIVREEYDIEIAFNRGAAARIISASTNTHSVKLVWAHNDYMRNDNPLAGFDSVEEASAAYRMFDKVVCVSEHVEKSFIEKFGDTGNTTTRYNIMDVAGIKKSADQPIEYTKDVFTIVACGRLHEQKNYSLLLDAVYLLNNRGLRYNLTIIGDGELKTELERQKSELQLNNVYLIGSKSNPYPYIVAADLYVSSSIYEGLSTTTIEALILGRPCVVTDCAGMKEILGENDKSGVVVPIEAQALADAIEKMMTDEEYRKHYEEQARIRAEYFVPEKAFKDIEGLFTR